MLTNQGSIAATTAAFEWAVPTHCNIGVQITDRPAATHGARTAIVDVGADGRVREISFAALAERSNQWAHVLAGLTEAGDRVAVLLPQSIEVAIAHAAILKGGRISLPLFTLFGPDALLHRLRDAGARVLLTNAAGAAVVAGIRGDLPELQHVICVEEPEFTGRCAHQPRDFTGAETRADDPAILIYTSGTTGHPKGALHGHRVLLGHLPGVEMSHDFFPQEGDRIWTPADWAWIGGLLDVLMPALYHGVTVVACRFRKFTAEAAFELMRGQGVRNAFLPPTALKLMRLADVPEHALALRSVASGGEPLGKGLIEWGQRALGTTINEFYGQTECNMIVSSCAALAPPEPGVMGFAVPGHGVEVLADGGGVAPVGEMGEIAVATPDPVMFLRYWNNPEATEAKFREVDGRRFLLTGDRGRRVESGRIAFTGREDDVISSAGYRIGPGEIEDCLLTHPAVHLAGVVGMPDALRGSVVAAYVQLGEGRDPSAGLAEEIAEHVRARLAAYEAPRVVRFIEAMPMTTTGKIIRADLRRMAQAEAEQG
ncbi:AMP-binding protein [Alphaproteobacteria bacterium KMM 3653]|uniref:AMP-binding protein n=1 Tax=Harenicola maris TaxID=2841044 RepID=A0AAP2G9W5_9RHOB|nr:AMP-binding protein [Harenicola maris]